MKIHALALAIVLLFCVSAQASGTALSDRSRVYGAFCVSAVNDLGNGDPNPMVCSSAALEALTPAQTQIFCQAANSKLAQLILTEREGGNPNPYFREYLTLAKKRVKCK